MKRERKSDPSRPWLSFTSNRYSDPGEQVRLTIGTGSGARSWTTAELGRMGIYHPRAPKILQHVCNEVLKVKSFRQFMTMRGTRIMVKGVKDATAVTAMRIVGRYGRKYDRTIHGWIDHVPASIESMRREEARHRREEKQRKKKKH